MTPPEENPPLRIGVLGAATIVPIALTGPAKSVPEAEIATIAARDPERAKAFAEKHAIPGVHDSYRAIIDDPELDAVYVPLPNSLHAEWTIAALDAGKHVLCEKPIASNATEAEAMAAAAERSGRVLFEAFAYRYHPLAARVKEIIDSGEIGRVRHYDAEFRFLLPFPNNIRFNFELAGGAAMDCGCYPVSLIRYLAGAEPRVESAKARLLRPQVDHGMVATLSFDDGRSARVQCGMLSATLFRSVLTVEGDGGRIKVLSPFQPHVFNRISVKGKNGKHSERVKGENAYALQLREFVDAVRTGRTPLTDAGDAIKTRRVIDAMYEKAGLQVRAV